MPNKPGLTQKLVDDMLGTTGVADYLHNVLHAAARLPQGRVARALSSADLVTELMQRLDESLRRDRGVARFIALWRRKWRVPSRHITPRTDAAGQNLESLARLLGLDPLEHGIVRLALELRLEPLLADLFRQLGTMGWTRRGGAVAALLGLPREAVAKALHPAGRLNQLGLIAADQGDQELELSAHFVSLLDEPRVLSDEGVRTLLLPPGRSTTLALGDFGHVADVDLAVEVLARALSSGKPGVNVLLYGEPGTGKTEFARVLAAATGATLLEVPSVEETRGRAARSCPLSLLAWTRRRRRRLPARSAAIESPLRSGAVRRGHWRGFSPTKIHSEQRVGRYAGVAL